MFCFYPRWRERRNIRWSSISPHLWGSVWKCDVFGQGLRGRKSNFYECSKVRRWRHLSPLLRIYLDVVGRWWEREILISVESKKMKERFDVNLFVPTPSWRSVCGGGGGGCEGAVRDGRGGGGSRRWILVSAEKADDWVISYTAQGPKYQCFQKTILRLIVLEKHIFNHMMQLVVSITNFLI